MIDLETGAIVDGDVNTLMNVLTLVIQLKALNQE